MYNLILALALVSQTPDFSSVAPARIVKVVKTNFATVDEIPPTAEIENGCKCGCELVGCECDRCPKMKENKVSKKQTIVKSKPVMYFQNDVWGYEWRDTDLDNLTRYVDGLNNGTYGHPHYNEIILRHRKTEAPVQTYTYSPPQTYSFSAGTAGGGCSGGSCGVGSRGLFGGFR